MADPRYDARIVTHVRVVTHTLGLVGPTSQLSHNHWSFYLLINDGVSSVRLNMAAKPGYMTGNLEISGYAYILTNSAIKHWDFAVAPGIVVGQLVSLIFNYRRHLYDMSGGGSGCRYWVWVVMSDFAARGYMVDTAAGNTLWPLLLKQYSLTGAEAPLAMVQGQFVNE